MVQSTLARHSPPDDHPIIEAVKGDADSTYLASIYHAALRLHGNMTTPEYLATHYDRDLLMTARFRFEAAIRDMYHPMIVEQVLTNSRVLEEIRAALRPEDDE